MGRRRRRTTHRKRRTSGINRLRTFQRKARKRLATYAIPAVVKTRTGGLSQRIIDFTKKNLQEQLEQQKRNQASFQKATPHRVQKLPGYSRLK